MKSKEAITAIREALAQPVQESEPPAGQPLREPSYWLGFGLQAHTEKPFEGATPLYTTPQQPEQKPTCPECKAAVLYECVACSSNNYPPKPEQKPDLTIVYQSGYYDGKKAALAKREWNFCERCGKRTADLTVIHTCTPPQENT